MHNMRSAAYAEVLLNILKRWVPITAGAFEEHKLGALTLSASAVLAINRKLAGENVTAENCGVLAREWSVLQKVLGL